MQSVDLQSTNVAVELRFLLSQKHADLNVVELIFLAYTLNCHVSAHFKTSGLKSWSNLFYPDAVTIKVL